MLQQNTATIKTAQIYGNTYLDTLSCRTLADQGVWQAVSCQYK
ncbi:hypothetical protein HNP71_002603 [Acidocella aromatica]|uniref:Uncharacterized protein n=1 Tax=Acidocella aromatica TaxID=1303579 RepID=A0A840VRW0_9PROT|nr:hypothetical protein [Acidocella aromatica]